MYGIKAILQKQPAVIAGTLRSLLYIGVLMGLVAMDEVALAGIALGAELLLGLFVFSNSTSFTQPTLKAGTSVNVQGSSDKVIIENSPPGPMGVEGEGDEVEE